MEQKQKGSVVAAEGHSQREKQWAANSSVLAAVGLTSFKIIVGISTGSLGILAEAAHSALDFVAAAMTAVAVKISGKPADPEHPYGHGKVENLSALFETLLLLITCFWIISSAVRRVFSGKVEIVVNLWSFLVIFISIVVDISRSRMLSKAAKKYNSQALEADALHFGTDIWSSLVVLVGLLCVKLGEWLKGYDWLNYADSVAAIGVGLIVIVLCAKLGMETIHALLDSAPKGLDQKIITAVEALPAVVDCHHVRIRHSGPQIFIDFHVLLNGDQTLRDAHKLTEEIEAVVRGLVPNADVTVHPEPD
ncbi:MAG TPA: cation diffusion facilitator family transporter [Candidatus Omnitrophota bacterium]|nr:cation diffusion facilitator family transporter [Candidatus Omnitrophota bacterium]HPS36262.1 cation diffusion facilitator family transporter [Candidatus Omnitrophota bacterium]